MAQLWLVIPLISRLKAPVLLLPRRKQPRKRSKTRLRTQNLLSRQTRILWFASRNPGRATLVMLSYHQPRQSFKAGHSARRRWERPRILFRLRSMIFSASNSMFPTVFPLSMHDYTTISSNTLAFQRNDLLCPHCQWLSTRKTLTSILYGLEA